MDPVKAMQMLAAIGEAADAATADLIGTIRSRDAVIADLKADVERLRNDFEERAADHKALIRSTAALEASLARAREQLAERDAELRAVELARAQLGAELARTIRVVEALSPVVDVVATDDRPTRDVAAEMAALNETIFRGRGDDATTGLDSDPDPGPRATVDAGVDPEGFGGEDFPDPRSDR